MLVPSRLSANPIRQKRSVGLDWVWARDEQAYAEAGSHPAEIVTLEEVGWMRGRRLVRLTFFPLRFDPVGLALNGAEEPTLEVARYVRLKLRFQNEDAVTEMAEWASDDSFTPILQHVVVNPDQAAQFARHGQVASTLAGPPTDIEYLIIAHSDFITAVAPLAAHRAINDGLRVFSTTVQEVYDAYSGDPPHEAIRSYISHIYHSAQIPTLRYVLLVGDGTEDGSDGQYIPPYMITMDPPWWPWNPWEAPSDNRFVTVDGSDNIPDISIGRLPVNSAAEATIVVEKILAYELNPPQWPWNDPVLFVSGNEDPNEPSETFHDDSDEVYYNHLPGAFAGQRIYFCTDDCTQPHQYDDITAAHDMTIARINAGALLVSYVGHSSWFQWGVDPRTWAPLFHVDDVPKLHNGDAFPVFLGMTCYTSRFADPMGDTLNESLLRYTDGGAVATWGSTTLARNSGHGILHREFFDSVFVDGTTTLGLATRAAKLALYRQSALDQDLLDTFILFGDPAMDLNLTIVPWADQLFLPLVQRHG